MKYYIIAAFLLGVVASIGYQTIVQKQIDQAYAKVISIEQPVTLSGTNTISAGQFIDTADSAYLIDPASTGNSLIVAGKIGIGTTAPSEGLEVAGNIKITGEGSITFPDATVQTTAGAGGPATWTCTTVTGSCVAMDNYGTSTATCGAGYRLISGWCKFRYNSGNCVSGTDYGVHLGDSGYNGSNGWTCGGTGYSGQMGVAGAYCCK